ncbi:MAG: hypothetical protein IJ039_07945 [Clostridia bacterium]|nr:hypothetical protein [Clostridia bacterium]
MKKAFLIIAMAAMLICLLAFGVSAVETIVSTGSLDEIHSAISAAEVGDEITVNLTGDIIIPKTVNAIVLDKDITVTVNFNGYTIVYNGGGGSAGSVYGMGLKSKGAKLILNGDTEVDYLNYTEPTDETITVSNGAIVNPNGEGTVYPDYAANGPAVVVFSGTVELNNMYVRNYNTGEWTVYFHPNMSECTNNIKATNSIIRSPQSRYAALGTRNAGGNLMESLVEIEGCVVYGTSTSEWLSMSANSYIKNSRFTTNAFKIDSYLKDNHAREGQEAILENVIFEHKTLQSCTGAIYVKMINCQFPNGMELYVLGDSQGKTRFTIIETATCEAAGRQAYVEASKGGGKTLTSFEDFPNVDTAYTEQNPALGHDIRIIANYEKGYLEKGYKRDGCTRCDDYVEKELAPLFACRGYSASENGSGIAIGYSVDVKAVSEYEEATGKTLKYGAFVVTKDKLGNNSIFGENGEAASGVINAEMTSYQLSVFELKIVGFTDLQKDIKLAMGAYVDNGTEYSYIQDTTKGKLDGKYYFASYNEIIK